MPGYRAHLACAAVVSLAVWWLYARESLDVVMSVYTTLSIFVGALAPDCDTRSVARRGLDIAILPMCAVAFWYRAYVGIALMVSLWCVAHLSPHRTVMHRVWFPFVLVGVLCVYAQLAGVHLNAYAWPLGGFILGYLSHLWLDGILHH